MINIIIEYINSNRLIGYTGIGLVILIALILCLLQNPFAGVLILSLGYFIVNLEGRINELEERVSKLESNSIGGYPYFYDGQGENLQDFSRIPVPERKPDQQHRKL